MIPSSAELTYFIEVANTLNLSRASERLGISQPSLSAAIKRLESTIGTEILIRQKRGVALTQAGKQLLAHAKQLLQYWQDTKSVTLASYHEVQGSVLIGCHPSIALSYATRFLSKLLAAYPKLEIQFKHDSSRNIVESVINLSIDIGIVINPVRHPDLIIQDLDVDRVTLWTNGNNSPLQNPGKEKAVIIHPTNLAETTKLLKRCRKLGIIFHRTLNTDSLELIADLTLNGCGIGVIPTCIASRYSALKPLTNAPFYKDTICLIYRHENRSVRAIEAITKAIKQSKFSKG